ncbi:MAG TPA: lysophospholipid acyltransferase family protein [Lysobacter sp.]|nr:lysophospholipid acyltransferase family protein [Lysobacter sp.]
MSAHTDVPLRPHALPRWLWAPLNLLQLAFTLAWTAGWISVALLVRLLSGGPRVPLRMAARIWAPGLLAGAGARLGVEGAERIDWSKPYIVVANHQSVIDICALFRAVPVPLRFMLKAELAKVPFLGWYTRAMGMVFVARGRRQSAAESLRHAGSRVRESSLCIFPEGTRSTDGRVGRFKLGAFQVALDTGVPVLPVAIVGSGAVLPPSGFRVRPGTIRVRFGAPIAAQADAPDARERLAQAAHDAVAVLLREAAP